MREATYLGINLTSNRLSQKKNIKIGETVPNVIHVNTGASRFKPNIPNSSAS